MDTALVGRTLGAAVTRAPPWRVLAHVALSLGLTVLWDTQRRAWAMLGAEQMGEWETLEESCVPGTEWSEARQLAQPTPGEAFVGHGSIPCGFPETCGAERLVKHSLDSLWSRTREREDFCPCPIKAGMLEVPRENEN